MAKCRECGKGPLKIQGVGYYGDTIEVECMNPECREYYEVESDGLGMAGLEMLDAIGAEMERQETIDL